MIAKINPLPRRNCSRAIAFVATTVALSITCAGLAVVLLRDTGPRNARPAPLDLGDPASVTTVFLQRYAASDREVCDLAHQELRAELGRDLRCLRSARTTRPHVTVLHTTSCGDHSVVQAEVSAPGVLGERYTAVDLVLDDVRWRVRAVRPVRDRHTLVPSSCAVRTPAPAATS